MPFKPRTAEEYINIRDKLDSEKHLHRGFGYREFDIFADLIPKTNIAKLMNVGSTNTIYDWLKKRRELLKQERGLTNKP
jgi:hypothetical protein